MVSATESLAILASDYPELAEDLSELSSLYTRKLWHQLTLKLEACFETAAFSRGDLPIRLFQNFVSDFAQKVNLLKLAHFSVHTSKFFPNPTASIEFLTSVIAKLEELKMSQASEPVLFLRMHVAQHKLETGAAPECKTLIESGKDSLQALTDVDPSVSAAVYYITSLYHKSLGNFAEYYKWVCLVELRLSLKSKQSVFYLQELSYVPILCVVGLVA
jgi:26S proteasome regulatory subunit N9